MTFNDVYFVVKYVFDYLNLPNFQHALNNISTKQNNTNNPSATNSLVNNEIHVLEDIQRAFGSPFWTKDQLFVYNQLFGKFRALGDEGVNNTIANAEIMRSQQGNVANYIAQIISPINQLKSTANQYLLLLDPLKEGFEGNDIIGNEDGIIEIIFDNNVEITNFVNSKSQMESWYIIIRGYAQLLSITPEDFEIISMSKASPAKFKIKTKLEGAKLILDIVVALLFIEKEFIPTKNLIDITRTNNILRRNTIKE